MFDIGYGDYAYGLWTIVVFSILIVLFLTFSFIKPKNKFEWRSMSAFMAFIAALFTEMYGIPLTIYFLSGWMGNTYPVLDPFSHSSGHLFLVFIGISHSVVAITILHIITNGIIFFGFYMVYNGWKLIYDAKEDQLVTQGIYSYIRHPQYTGLFLVTIGFLIQWPTILTLAMWPILMFTYYRLTKREDKELETKFGKEFLEYKKRVPAFLPEYKKINNRKVIL